MKETPKYLFIVLFFGLLLFPWINGHLDLVEDIENKENRRLNEKPELDINYLDPFPEDYEAYYIDHFNLRNSLIALKNAIIYDVFDQTPLTSKVLKGKDGWLFFKENIENDYKNQHTFSDSLLEGLATELVERTTWCKQHNMELFTVFIPRKYSVYPEKVPGNYIKSNDKSNLELFMDVVRKHPELNCIDLTPALTNAKEQHPVYHKLDMHWNDFGALTAYQTILSEISKKVPLSNETLPLDSFNMEYRVNYKIDFLGAFSTLNPPIENQLFLVPKFTTLVKDGPKSNYPKLNGFSFNRDIEIVKVNPSVKKPKAFVIRDSFTTNLISFLSENFAHSTYLWDAWKYKLHREKLLQEKPDVVIIIVQEPGLDTMVELANTPKEIEE